MSRSVAGLITGRRIKYAILVFWLAVAVVAVPLAGKLSGAEKNDAKSWLPVSAESIKVLDVQQSFSSPNAVPAVVIYERSSGITDADRAKAAADIGQFKEVADVEGEPIGPVPSADGKALQTVLSIDLGSEGWSKAGTVIDKMRTIATSGDEGLSAHVTGPAGSAADSGEAVEGIDGVLLYGTIGVVILILLITYRSPMLWILPVVSAGVALIAAQAVIYLCIKYADLTVNAQSAGILTVLVFGAGTDYALLLIARYREELRRHADRHEAMAVALHRAGPAIIASAATVMVGMLCLLFAETNSTKGLGPVCAIGVLVGLGIMLTLLPALLVTVGRWIFWPFKPRHGSTEPTASGLWARVGGGIGRAPRLTWIGTAAALGALAIGIVQLDATGLTDEEQFKGRPDSIVGAEALARHFPAGAGNPVGVISRADRAGAVKAVLVTVDGIDPTSVGEPRIAGGRAYLEATLDDPADSQAAFDTIDRIRDKVHAVEGADAKVGGTSAINLDVKRAAQYDRNVIIPVVLCAVLIILMLLLRAVVAPLLLVATVVLSFGAALGASALLFRHVFGYGGADTSLPLFVFVFLVALGIDYNIFLMTRVREEALRHGTRRGSIVGLAATGGVITSAGAVLAGTFLVLATLPLVAFAEIGIAVAIGVLMDTIVVRSVLVTALNLDLGRWIWWPSRLASKTDEPAGDDEAQREPSLVGGVGTA